MKVAFLHVRVESHRPEFHARIAQIMIDSVKRNIPDSWVIQMTDLKTPILGGVDESRRLAVASRFVMPYRLKHLAMLKCEALILDTDVVVLQDPTHVFDMDFDVCLTKRDKQIISPEIGYGVDDPLMPYNTGVMFSRSVDFWKDALDVCESLEDRHKEWYGDQISVAAVVERRKHNVAVLKCDKWNYTPSSPDENLDERNIVHFKGKKKKEWMLRFAAQKAAA